ncbi:hypothetical protein [Actinoplanes sp. NPDC051859]|uniref:hypothetical protein n=1 Tax=Actinoplanes sp. NPDC051859 TaxID=3363909 RepID=UPI003799DD0E
MTAEPPVPLTAEEEAVMRSLGRLIRVRRHIFAHLDDLDLTRPATALGEMSVADS